MTTFDNHCRVLCVLCVVACCVRTAVVMTLVVVGTCQLFVLAAQGQVYHFQNLQLSQLKEGLCWLLSLARSIC